MTEFLLDFDQVALAGRSSRHRPTFPVAQLEHASNPAHRHHALVQERKRFHHDAWFLPLVDSYVRTWLKKVRFSQPPIISVSGVEVACGKPVEPPDPVIVADWVRHYGSGYFDLAVLRKELLELVEYRRQFAHGKEHEREPRLAALRQLLEKEAVT